MVVTVITLVIMTIKVLKMMMMMVRVISILIMNNPLKVLIFTIAMIMMMINIGHEYYE